MDVFHYRNEMNSMNSNDFPPSILFFSQVCDWPLGASGLLCDRIWMVVNSHGVCLSQKREPRLCQILPPTSVLSADTKHLLIEPLSCLLLFVPQCCVVELSL